MKPAVIKRFEKQLQKDADELIAQGASFEKVERAFVSLQSEMQNEPILSHSTLFKTLFTTSARLETLKSAIERIPALNLQNFVGLKEKVLFEKWFVVCFLWKNPRKQLCPLFDEKVENTDWFIIRLDDSMQSLHLTSLGMHQIVMHQFFRTPGHQFRVDPATLVSMFKLGDVASPWIVTNAPTIIEKTKTQTQKEKEEAKEIAEIYF